MTFNVQRELYAPRVVLIVGAALQFFRYEYVFVTAGWRLTDSSAYRQCLP